MKSDLSGWTFEFSNRTADPHTYVAFVRDDNPRMGDSSELRLIILGTHHLIITVLLARYPAGQCGWGVGHRPESAFRRRA
jgi:hypothetical protein